MRNRNVPNRPQNPRLAKEGGVMKDMVQKARSEAAGKEMKKGGPVKKAMGGVGKIRHEQATKEGMPLKKGGRAKK